MLEHFVAGPFWARGLAPWAHVRPPGGLLHFYGELYTMRLLLASLLTASALFADAPALMPLPAKITIEASAGALPIDGKFTVAGDLRLDAALTRFIARLSRQTGITIAARKPVKPAEATLRVTYSGRSSAAYPALGEDESYTLDITPDGASIKAVTPDGAMHGLETFAQSIQPGPDGFRAPAMHIEDYPRFAWRGLMMDVSRHFMPVETVERNLDAMAAVKLNVLHWHLSDDQGFRVESRLHPRLQQMGSDGFYYTQAQIRTVVAYARDRGIRVVPEFDIPGHSASWLPGYPVLASGKGPFDILRNFGVSLAVFDPTRETTYTFLDSFVGEMAALFPDKYFHIGGDEVNPRQWNESPRIQAFEKAHGMKNAHDLQVYFNKRVLKILTKHGKTMIGWDEILHPDLPKSTVVHIWRNQASLANAVQQGYRAILSWGYYLDHLSPAKFHYAVDPLGGAAAQLTDEQAKNVLGGEACMWAELVDPETVDSRIWPRTAAIAERLWSPRETTDIASMYWRMEAVSRNLEWTGVEHRATYGPMLDRISGQRDEPLRLLADAAEGLGCCSQRRPARITTQTPLNRFADAVRPESESVRALENAAARLAVDPAGDTADAALLREQFTQWAANDARFQASMGTNALLNELKPLSTDLSALGVVGLRVLDAWNSGATLPPDWVTQQNAEVARMLKPYPSEVVLAAARVLKTLLDSVAPKGR
jgi:hexosaminidase